MIVMPIATPSKSPCIHHSLYAKNVAIADAVVISMHINLIIKPRLLLVVGGIISPCLCHRLVCLCESISTESDQSLAIG